MDLIWLKRNIVTSWSNRISIVDAFKRLLLIYSNHLPERLRKGYWEIGFRYSPPVGEIRLRLRANRGADTFIHGEVFEHGYYDLHLPFKPDTILDLGANIGLTCVYFARCFPHALIAAVEPMPANLLLLRMNLDLNDVKAEVIAGAIDAVDGQVLMDIEQLDYGYRVLDSCEAGAQRGFAVAGYSVPTVLRRLGWERIGLLKVDIEGHERTLLADCASWIDRVDAICIECHDGFGEAQLGDFASRWGFRPPHALPGIWLLTR